MLFSLTVIESDASNPTILTWQAIFAHLPRKKDNELFSQEKKVD